MRISNVTLFRTVRLTSFRCASALDSRAGRRQLFRQRLGPFDSESLSVIYAEAGQLCFDCSVFHVLGNGLQAHRVAHLIDCRDHRVRDRIFRDLPNELPVDFEKIDRECLEIGERTQARAEIIEGEPTAFLSEDRYKLFRTLHIENGRRFRHLEANSSHWHAGARQFANDEIEEAVIADGLAGQIYGEEAFLLCQPRDKVSQHLQAGY